MKIFHYKQDWRSVIFTLIALCLLLVPFVKNIPVIYVPGWLVLSGLFCFNACVINHNHVHTPVFRYAVLNGLFGILLTLTRGHTSAGVILAHNYNHHVHNGNANDWIRPQLAGSGPGIVRLIRFVVKAVITMSQGRRTTSNSILTLQVVRQMQFEKTVLLLFITSCIVIDANSFFIYMAIPWLSGVILLIGVNLLQHDSCSSGSKYDHSRNFTGRFGNWFFFNNGYHTVHHMNPALHWSQLPVVHDREVAPCIDKKLEKKSILSFLIKNYIIAK